MKELISGSSSSDSGEDLSLLRQQLSVLDMGEICDFVREDEDAIEQGEDNESGRVEFVGELREGQVVTVDGVASVVVPMVAVGYPDDRIYVPGPVWEDDSVRGDVFADVNVDLAMNNESEDDQVDGGDSGFGLDMSSPGNEE